MRVILSLFHFFFNSPVMKFILDREYLSIRRLREISDLFYDIQVI